MKDSNKEKQKYDKIYNELSKGKGRLSGYGHSNHGKSYLTEANKYKSVLDIGCGHNEFIKLLRGEFPQRKLIGIDFSCPGADMNEDVLSLPFEDKEFELLTSFDMLEHVAPDDVDDAFREMCRVSKRFSFRISYRPSCHSIDNENLHPTVRPEQWWIDKISKFSKSCNKWNGFIIGEWI